jgi:hypothetical protein
MTYPGFQAHQAAQANSTRVGQEATLDALRRGREYQRAHGSPSGMVHRFIRFVITTAVLLAALGVLTLVVKQADPSLYHQAVSWLKHLH